VKVLQEAFLIVVVPMMVRRFILAAKPLISNHLDGSDKMTEIDWTSQHRLHLSGERGYERNEK